MCPHLCQCAGVRTQAVVKTLVQMSLHSYSGVRLAATAALHLTLKRTPCLAPLVMPSLLGALAGVRLPSGGLDGPPGSIQGPPETYLEQCLPVLLPLMGQTRDAGELQALSPAGPARLLPLACRRASAVDPRSGGEFKHLWYSSCDLLQQDPHFHCVGLLWSMLCCCGSLRAASMLHGHCMPPSFTMHPCHAEQQVSALQQIARAHVAGST